MNKCHWCEKLTHNPKECILTGNKKKKRVAFCDKCLIAIELANELPKTFSVGDNLK